MTSTTLTTQRSQTQLRSKSSSRSLRKPFNAVSTPNLKAAYASHSRLAPPALSRKASLAALTPSSLASIPDVSESYALDSVLSDSSQNNMPPATPGRPTGDDVAAGDVVDVPGGMFGTVRWVGSVAGKKGTFAGVELDQNFAARGKNNGDVDGISYFNTTVLGAGIFVPVAKVLRRDSFSIPSIPMTPTASAYGGLRAGNQNSVNYTPPTPSLPKFSASVGPGARAPSPQGKRAPRTSLPRPDSPVRRLQMTPGPRPSMTTPAKAPSRYGSPTNRTFAQSVRGTAGDPSKRSKLERKPSIGPRSASALGSAHGLDDDTTPVGVQRTMTNGSLGSVSSFGMKMRPASRAAAAQDEEIERLRSQLEDRDRQLKDQGSTLAEMESSLVELQGLMEHADGLPPPRRNSLDDKDSTTLRLMLREKNEKIAMLTAEFDAHRADFRSTIDTLEMASTETERVYEKRIEELMADVRELESRNVDVDSVASQLKQLEELVQELEEGLEDARRGEAEARGEVEFLRGEVERTRSELRREREKTAAGANANTNGDKSGLSKELEAKEDEIRGLKAIIHSLSRDSVPGAEDRTPTHRPGSFIQGNVVENKIARDNLERQVAELQSILDKKNSREEELEQELDAFRQGNNNNAQRNSVPLSAHRSSLRDSRDTVVLARAFEARSPEATHKRGNTLSSMPESDAYSTATETSTLWCEICETNGHDILTCTNMFGSESAKMNGDATTVKVISNHELKPHTPTGNDAPAPLSPFKLKAPGPPSLNVKILPNPMESGPVAGKESGIMDPEKWCALCERDGHDSVDCPFEDAF
ncbi:Fc.00g061760.m01.CDS01 [Cosmosporella sp. VM-42]